MKNFKPMLAATVKDIQTLPYPMIASPKLDGIRCVKLHGMVYSRKLKLIPNLFVRNQLRSLPDNVDGELLVGNTFQDVTSGIMSIEGEPDFMLHAFDVITEQPYFHRQEMLKRITHPRLLVVPTVTVCTPTSLLEFEEKCLDEGYEGVCLRAPNGPYKFGRSTVREGYLLKLKRFVDAEAKVLAIEEQMQNTNEATTDELGRTKRSSAKAGKVGKDTMGKFKVQDCATGVEFYVGTGFSDELRAEIWANKKKYIGKILTYKSQPFGVKDAPRLPVFKGFRED